MRASDLTTISDDTGKDDYRPSAGWQRLGDRWFARSDAEACRRGWQIIKTHGGRGRRPRPIQHRRYRDPRFDALGQVG